MKDTTIAFFDFDGTITKRDSLLDFIRFYHGWKKFIVGLFLLSPWLVFYLIGLVPNWQAKEKMISHYFRGESFIKFQHIADLYGKFRLPHIIRKSALSEITALLEKKTEVVIVSASAEPWLRLWCEEKGVQLIGTRLEVKNGLLTGRFEGKNCYGEEKVCRIRQQYHLQDYGQVRVYGDSTGDQPMMGLGNVTYFRYFQ